ncbi:MAG: FAD:protein FMN transferase [Rubellimicrobium sp.]|nr:FAD:protein FMN transferase [Rubellimicrobium sp.]
MTLTRRRFLTISAVAATLPAAARADAPQLVWTGQALGARASIRLDHPDAQAIAARVQAEIERLDAVFSLYRTDSALVRLNRDGRLEAPPFELLDCLATAGAVHGASGGAFDPTVQPLWALWAESVTAGADPAPDAIARVARGWAGVAFDAGAVKLAPGMALTLNGVAQGHIADRVAALLTAEGLTGIFIDTGEMRALGASPAGGGWPVTLESGPRIRLASRALATSSPLGTTFDQAGRLGHILDPRTGAPVPPHWSSVSISADSAALADALSTAACVVETQDEITAMIARFPGARIEALAA